MLELVNIKKDYPAGDGVVHALKGVNLLFRRSEFVSILGPSGCGKTTLLNIVGGLDGYTSGDLIINGISTKKYKARDWDAYRNHSIGFVFQSYNLIPHQTVLQNVELALTLSGVSKRERRKRAKEALVQVGLGTQLNKRPSQLSGGQMQRVAIARALVNNPDIILADEPTGALDTETSVQVMDILKEISKDRLIIMVTHNPELAERYSSRIIRILDGEITDDSNPLSDVQVQVERGMDKEDILRREGKREKKPSMAFHTSFGLSLRNLFTKKGRTLLTSFAGSIGIIGIALILSISTGLNSYIDAVEEETLTAYPITLESSTMDLGTILSAFMGNGSGSHDHENDAVYENESLYDMMNALGNLEFTENDLKSFRTHLINEMEKDSEEEENIKDALSGVSYTYNLDVQIYTKNLEGEIVHSDLEEIMQDLMMSSMGFSSSTMSELKSSPSASFMNSYSGYQVTTFQELLEGLNGETVNEVLKKQYDLVYGDWPTDYDEVVVVLDRHNEIDDITLYALGLVPREQVEAVSKAAVDKTEIESPNQSWSYEEICNHEFRLILNTDCFVFNPETDTYDDMRDTGNGLSYLYDNALPLKVVGIIRPNEDANSTMLKGTVGYTSKLVKYVAAKNAEASIIEKQKETPDIDVFNGLVFDDVAKDFSAEQKAAEVDKYFAGLSDEEKAAMYVEIMSIPSEEDLNAMVDAQMAGLDRATIEMSMVGAYAAELGISEEEILAYLASMSDEDLFAMVREQVSEQVKEQYAANVVANLSGLDPMQLIAGFDMICEQYTVDEKAALYKDVIETSSSTYEENLLMMGDVDLSNPATINLYASSFDNKDVLVDFIADYNEGKEQLEKIEYTDYIGIMLSSITTILNAITYILIAFVAISLIVSSIMIGVITLISVQERTKEIGILRAIGASKKDVSSLFNAETIIIGFTSGLIGVIVTVLLCFPINALIHHLTNIAGLKAFLPWQAGIILVLISVFLTLIAGIIPSHSASKKDPVVALRSE